MKRKINYLLPAIAVLLLAAGCAKSTIDASSNVVLPTGNFTGQFIRIHVNPSTRKADTIKANITLSLFAATGFAVGGDTTLHAGSHGGYAVDAQNNIAFSDATLPAIQTSVIPTKIHLNGVYQYAYSGTGMLITASTDTTAFYYNLTLKP